MKIKYVLFAFVLMSCDERFKESEIYGRYTPSYGGSFDTLELRPQGVYHRVVYDAKKKLLLDMNGQWIFKNKHRVVLDNFYLNLDDDLVKFPESVKDTAMMVDTYFETQNDKIKFCVGYYPDKNCYWKVAK